MAKRSDIMILLTRLDITLTETQQIAICSTTPNEFDLEKTVATVSLKSRPTAADIKHAIIKHACKGRSGCEFCIDGFIPVLDRDRNRIRDAKYKYAIELPKNVTKCSCAKGKPQALIDEMTISEQAWQYVILYDWLCYRLEKPVKWNEFSTEMVGISMIPQLGEAQITMMVKIYDDGLKTSDKRPAEFSQQVMEKINQTKIVL